MWQLWLKNPRTGAVWKLTPRDPYDTNDGCRIAGVSGFGYENEIKTFDVQTARFTESVKRKTPDVKGTLHFANQAHFDNFAVFVGDFSLTFELHCDHNGVVPEDITARTWYKSVIISKIEKAEKNKCGWYEVPVTLYSMSIWRRDVDIEIELKTSGAAQALTYPYTYPFYYDGAKWLGEIDNKGLAAPLRLELTNVGTNPEWIVMPANGEYQRAKFNLSVGVGETLVVDSNPERQIAQIESLSYNEPSHVYDLQEPDADYINFVSIPNGKSTVSIDIENQAGAVIKVIYAEQKDVL